MYNTLTVCARKFTIEINQNAEMARMTYCHFHDYNQNKNIFTSIIEGIEGGYYFEFLKIGEQEMKERFTNLKIINVDKRAAWYVNIFIIILRVNTVMP